MTAAAGRVALLLPSLDCGGAERVFVTLANAFQRRGVPVDLVVATHTGPLSREVAPAVNIVVLGGSRVLAALVPLVRYIRATRPRAMFATMIDMNLLAVAAARVAGRPARLVLREAVTPSIHRREAGGFRHTGMDWLRPWIYGNADYVISPSRGVADDLERRYGIDGRLIATIPNPIDIEMVRGLARGGARPAAFGDGRAPLVVAVGRLSAQKDYPTLIAAFARVRRDRPARLLILGEGRQRPALERLVGELGLADDVRLPGFSENPFAFMAEAAVFVLSSRYEGLPNSLLQALAVGVPVVATDCPSGPREILDGGRWGRLVPIGDVDRMAAAIREAIDGRLEMMPARQVVERFDVDVVADQYLKLLDEPVAASASIPS